MKEHPIIFSTPMVQAIMDGRKTMTRRVVTDNLIYKWYNPLRYIKGVFYQKKNSKWQKGKLYWVRECFARCPKTYKPGGIIYRADGKDDHVARYKWHPSIHMPKKAARLWLEVISVKVERVQEISEEDAIAEGVWGKGEKYQGIGDLPSDRFQCLWDSLNAKRGYGWNQNPWVWVIEFKRILCQ